MFLFLSSVLTVYVIGSFAAHVPNIDINRIHEYRNDDDNHSRGQHGSPRPLRLHVPSTNYKNDETSLQVHQPREDPRLFYQSDTYLKEINGQNINQEVNFIYPGREVIHAAEDSSSKLMQLRVERGQSVDNSDFNICIRCPRDISLVAQIGSDRVLLQAPRLFSCSGRRAQRNVQFVHMYGPKFGFLLEHGSHLIIGKIMKEHRTIRMCKMQVHVLMQSCAIPKYLSSNCIGQNCSFTCRNPKLNLNGQKSLMCGSNMKWNGELPVCRAVTWCEQPLLPEHGRLSCDGFTEGSRCRVRCSRGWRWYPRAVTVCRRGAWTYTLTCQKIKYPS